jgi:hypothetical protein
MAALSEQLRALELPGKVALAAVLFTLYLAALAVYRLYWHPLAKFPGPRLAAVTSWYEAYYEIALTGQYWKQISLLHDQYGMCMFTVRDFVLVPTSWFDISRG